MLQSEKQTPSMLQPFSLCSSAIINSEMQIILLFIDWKNDEKKTLLRPPGFQNDGT